LGFVFDLLRSRFARLAGRSAVRHLFQSFWHGGPLSPYESFCLRSFIDHGHSFDLYTHDLNLAVPAGVRVVDASELMQEASAVTG